MKKPAIAFLFLFFSFVISTAQQVSSIKEYKKVFKTYPYSDPDPIPEMGKTYPYFRFDGYTNTAVQKSWKVVELENDYLRLIILPEIGGKIWAAYEKSTGRSFVYDNHTVKFRDVGMRGPWTSGGIEPNYGIIGHTPNTFTPVDYTTLKKADGSVSCIIGVLDLLTRTTWRIDINLPKDKAYLTTSSFWYNGSSLEQPYYTWMNTGLPAKGNLEFIYPGTKYLGHGGEVSDWPINKENGKDISFYENNDFGGPKSYHVFGKYTDFFGAYWHDEDFGMGRYSNHDDKAGKKIWIWGLSNEGMIWEKLLTDTSGQYVEVQSGRSFNQAAEQSSFTPFKHKNFLPKTTDTWTEYWFPVLRTRGMVAANDYGTLNIKQADGLLHVYFCPLQKIDERLVIRKGEKTVYEKRVQLNTLQTFQDSFKFDGVPGDLVITVGTQKLQYESAPSANTLSRPVETPADFDWNSSYGLYLKGKEDVRQRFYIPAEQNLRASLAREPYYVPALSLLSMVLYRNMQYDAALVEAKKALSVDTYDEAANYYYGVINNKLGNLVDAKDGFDIASMGVEYRSAAWLALANIYLREQNIPKAAEYARKAIRFNGYSIEGYQLLAVIHRIQKNRAKAQKVLDTLLLYDPLNHFARFEKYLWEPTAANKQQFSGLVRNEMPRETYLELATWYYQTGLNEEALKLLRLAPPNAEVSYWIAFLSNKKLDLQQLSPDMVFPFRAETADVLRSLLKANDHWLLKYHLALIEWNFNNLVAAEELFKSIGIAPRYAPFYAARAKFNMKKNDPALVLADLERAAALDKGQWRYGNYLVNHYLKHQQPGEALLVAKEYKSRFKDNFVLAMLYARTLLVNKKYREAHELLKTIQVLPNEGATAGRQLYKETELMLSVGALKNKQYAEALKYVDASREWPENLGVGKPYAADIDERLEDWMAWLANKQLGNSADATKMLEKILAYPAGRGLGVNNLVTAWALKETGQPDSAKKLLADYKSKKPDDVYASWAQAAYEGNPENLPGDTQTNENYRVLAALVETKW